LLFLVLYLAVGVVVVVVGVVAVAVGVVAVVVSGFVLIIIVSCGRRYCRNCFLCVRVAWLLDLTFEPCKRRFVPFRAVPIGP